MMVSWTPLSLSEARGFITHYTVAYFPQQSSSKQQEPNTIYKNVSSDSNQTTIDGLDGSTDYGVQVSASTNAGSGDFSPVKLARALSGTQILKTCCLLIVIIAGKLSNAVIVVIVVVILVLVMVIAITVLSVLKMRKNKRYNIIIYTERALITAILIICGDI